MRLEQLATSLETQRVTVEQLIAVKEPTVDLEKFQADQAITNQQTSEVLSDLRRIQSEFMSKAYNVTREVDQLQNKFTLYETKHLSGKELSLHVVNLISASDSVLANQHAIKAEVDERFQSVSDAISKINAAASRKVSSSFQSYENEVLSLRKQMDPALQVCNFEEFHHPERWQYDKQVKFNCYPCCKNGDKGSRGCRRGSRQELA